MSTWSIRGSPSSPSFTTATAIYPGDEVPTTLEALTDAPEETEYDGREK